MNNDVLSAAIQLAFEAGRWAGQVDLEEHYDRELSINVIEAIASKKTAMPLQAASKGKTVTVNLRSDDWRIGVRKRAQFYLDIALELANTGTLNKQPGD